MSANQTVRRTNGSLVQALFTSNNIILALIATLLIALSIFIQKNAESQFLSEFGVHLLRDVSIAIYISILLAVFIERSHREEMMRGLDEKVEKLTESVFAGVFKADLPTGLISEAINLILKQQVVRENWQITYTLADKETRHHGSYAELKARNSYRLRNVSYQRALVDIGLSLPNPLINELRQMVKVGEFKIDGRAVDVGAKNMEITQKLSATADNANVVLYSTHLEPNHTVEVSLFYTMVKEREDSEVLRSYFPSDGIDVKIFDETDHTRTIGALSIHRLPLEDRAPAGDRYIRHWALPQYILPKQGIIFWWKRGENVAAVESSTAGTT